MPDIAVGAASKSDRTAAIWVQIGTLASWIATWLAFVTLIVVAGASDSGSTSDGTFAVGFGTWLALALLTAFMMVVWSAILLWVPGITAAVFASRRPFAASHARAAFDFQFTQALFVFLLFEGFAAFGALSDGNGNLANVGSVGLLLTMLAWAVDQIFYVAAAARAIAAARAGRPYRYLLSVPVLRLLQGGESPRTE